MNIPRREFIKNAAVISAFVPFSNLLFAVNDDSKLEKATIDSIELFRYDIDIPRYFSFGTWKNRQHVFMKISSGGHYGWSEIPGSTNNPDFSLEEWGTFIKPFKGISIKAAQRLLASNQKDGSSWSWGKMEFVDMGLLDLAGKVLNKPSIELLGLKGRSAVPGMFCILEKDPEMVKERVRQSIKQGLSHHLKVKIFGDEKLDFSIVKAAKETLGDKSILICDPNAGYKTWANIDELAKILINLREIGLDAMEDPAKLTVSQWVELQQKVGKLKLIPDEPMRPAWEGLRIIAPGMGQMYNLHPSCMGSFEQLAKLARKIKDMKSGIMIGDDSLAGPGCNAWQQIAVGVGADWVEALEKDDDSKNYLPCIKSKAMYKDKDGNFALNPKPGFGLELDEKLIREVCIKTSKL